MKRNMTAAQAIKLARHDFLNDLHLIGMYLDVGRPERARQLIQAASQQAEQWNRIAALAMPELEQWLLVAGWRFPELAIRVECRAAEAPARCDGAFSKIAESVMTAVCAELEPDDSCTCTIRLEADGERFRLLFLFSGTEMKLDVPETAGIQTIITCGEGLLTIEASAQMEG